MAARSCLTTLCVRLWEARWHLVNDDVHYDFNTPVSYRVNWPPCMHVTGFACIRSYQLTACPWCSSPVRSTTLPWFQSWPTRKQINIVGLVTFTNFRSFKPQQPPYLIQHKQEPPTYHQLRWNNGMSSEFGPGISVCYPRVLLLSQKPKFQKKLLKHNVRNHLKNKGCFELKSRTIFGWGVWGLLQFENATIGQGMRMVWSMSVDLEDGNVKLFCEFHTVERILDGALLS